MTYDLPEIECPACDGNGWLPRRWAFNSRVQLTEETCTECNGTGWRVMTDDEAADAAEAAHDAMCEGEPPLTFAEGAEIPTPNGRPAWLVGPLPEAEVKSSFGWFHHSGPTATEKWQWDHIEAIRLPADHPYYAGLAAAAAQPQSVSPELLEAMQAGGRVIDYAASILWNGRSAAIANRPAKVDSDLRTFRIALETLPQPVDPLVDAMSEAMCGVPGEDYTQPAADLRAELAKRGLEIVARAESSQ